LIITGACDDIVPPDYVQEVYESLLRSQLEEGQEAAGFSGRAPLSFLCVPDADHFDLVNPRHAAFLCMSGALERLLVQAYGPPEGI
jgi:hypothetical protein